MSLLILASNATLRDETLVEMIQYSGTHGKLATASTVILLVTGVRFLFKKPALRVCVAHLAACLFPAAAGVAGFAAHFMNAFATLGRSGAGDGYKLLAALGEISVPMMLGFAGSGAAFILSAIVLLLCPKQEPHAPGQGPAKV